MFRKRVEIMQFQKFKEWLEQNTTGYKVFVQKSTELQNQRNQKRTGKTKKWNEAKIARAVNSMWTDVAKNAYEQIKTQKGVPKYNGYQIWLDYLSEIEFLENFDDSMNELEFE